MKFGELAYVEQEAPIHQNIKQALVDGDERSTTHIFRTLSNTERVYKNKMAEKASSPYTLSVVFSVLLARKSTHEGVFTHHA